MSSGSDLHNRLATEFVMKVLREVKTEAECMVALESCLLGAMLYFRPEPLKAAEFLDTMTMRVIERLGNLANADG